MLGTIIEREDGGRDAVTAYTMHVSSKYLDLTRKKLELTRLPRELELPDERRWDLGTPKAVLEPLLDFWLEHYDWRTQEAHFNTALPQYRTTISLSSPLDAAHSPTTDDSADSLRIHFVHRRSRHQNAVPLLFCHAWPSSFIEVEKVIEALTDPADMVSFGAGAQQAFHVVAPSIPGFGFSDASPTEAFGLEETAQAFNAVMGRLGYEQYVAHGAGWGFSVCRALALGYPKHCVAVHTANPAFVEPTLKQSPMAFLKYRIARATRAKISSLSFGYVPSELRHRAKSDLKSTLPTQSLSYSQGSLAQSLSRFYSHRPQTLAFSLCDSPIGLLAGLLDVIHTRAPLQSLLTSRSQSPFLSPVELEMQDSPHDQTSGDVEMHSATAERHEQQPLSPCDSERNARNYTWSPTEVLNWTMMQWLPGPEASLRWLRRAHIDSAPASPFSTSYCPVPLGVSQFRDGRNSNSDITSTPLMWGSASWNLGWVKRHQRPASLPAWEAPDLLVLDMRECFGTFLPHGIGVNLPTPATPAVAGSGHDKIRGRQL